MSQVQVIGYGEDSLTFWAFTQHLAVVMQQLGDGTDPKEFLFFYRPSFGRKGGQYSAEFGEFDGILATQKAVYPIESKWVRSATRGGLATVKQRQVLRHVIFQWLRKRWQPKMTWNNFREAHHSAFAADFHQKPLAPVGTSLAHNIEFMLNALAAYPPNVQHVVMAFHREERQIPLGVTPVLFRLVTLPFESINLGGLFVLRER
jgi:hypothetical protein